MKTFNFYNDPGHGWLQVSAADLRAVDLTPRDFTRYSYRSKGAKLFYLEEDCDASKFVEAYEAKNGGRPEFKDRYQARSFIRSLPAIWSDEPMGAVVERHGDNGAYDAPWGDVLADRDRSACEE